MFITYNIKQIMIKQERKREGAFLGVKNQGNTQF